MRNNVLIILYLLIVSFAFAGTPSVERQFYNRSDFVFTPNQGQVLDINGKQRPDILYTAQSHGVKLFFQKNTLSYVFPQVVEEAPRPTSKFGGPSRKITQLYRVDLEFVGANPEATVINQTEAPGVSNFFLG